MKVFNVTGQDGNKVKDEAILDYIRKSLGPESCVTPPMRPGLLSEVSAVLTNLKCNIVNAEVWTHNIRAAAVMHVNDEETGSAITDPQRLSLIKELLCNVLGGGNKKKRAKTVVAVELLSNLRIGQSFSLTRFVLLTDMQYVVFHANIDAERPQAYQEYYIKHIDGSPVKSDAERQRVIQCLEAAIERRVSEVDHDPIYLISM
ncbi:ACT domain [Sesbania bispinosa]|nr:ACT domain [Sesbania bispinosa]